MRGLRRLRREVELRLGAAAGNRVRPQAHHRPVVLQQGLLLREGLLPVVRHRARREAEEGQGRRADAAMSCRCRSPRCRSSAGPTTSSSPASAAPASSPSAASSAWPRISKARASASSTWPASRRRAARSTATCASPSGRRTSTPSASRPAAPTSCSAATSWWPATRRCWRRSSPADRDGRQHRRIPARRLHPQRRLLAADRAAQARDHRPRAGAEQTPFHRRDAARHRAVRRIASAPTSSWSAIAYQLGAIPLSARCDRAGDRAQRRGGGDEPRGVPLGPPRRARSALRSRRWRSRRPKATTRPQAVAVVRRDGRAPRRIPHRLSECRLCGALSRRWSRRCKAAEAAKAPGQCGLAEAVARYLFKLMAYKDEYEVARLYTDGDFMKQVANDVRGREPALRIPSRAAAAGEARSGDRRAAQDDVRPVDDDARSACWRSSSSCAARALDRFGYTAERATERKLIADYEALLDEVLARLTADNHALAVGARRDPGEDPRLRPRQGAPPRRRQGRRGGAARAVPLRPGPAAQGRGVTGFRMFASA